MRYLTPQHLEFVAEGALTSEGRWPSPPLIPARYALTVGTMTGDVWHRRELDVTRSELLHVSMLPGEIAGTVSLGDTPLQARLTIRDDDTMVVQTSSDVEGRFRAAVPQTDPQQWSVSVASDHPRVKRTVRGLRLSPSGTLDVHLPASTLSGETRDPTGAPVPNALVSLTRSDGAEELFVQTVSGPDGAFLLHGIAPGKYTLEAATASAASDAIVVDYPAEEVALVLRDKRRVRGRVVSEFGPVPGATVVVEATDAPALMTIPTKTDERGRFEVVVPPSTGAIDIVVAAGGFAYTLDHVPYRDRPLDVALEHRGGTLRIEGIEDPRQLFLIQNGAMVSFDLLAMAWSVRLTAGAMVIPMMEPGPYVACDVPRENRAWFQRTRGAAGGVCASGFLPMHGETSLKIPKKERAAG